MFLAATVVHASVSFFWAAVLTWLLPHRNTTVWAIVALSAIAILDLRVIGPLFPPIAALDFWPQFADHMVFGVVLGLTLEWRRKRRAAMSAWSART